MELPVPDHASGHDRPHLYSPDVSKHDRYAIGFPLIYRILLTFLFIFPLGFLMGFPFPTGIRLLDTVEKKLIPWAWATNAFSSVIGSILALMIAFWGGYIGKSLNCTASFQEGLQMGLDHLVEIFSTKDALEDLTSVVERRRPVFRGE